MEFLGQVDKNNAAICLKVFILLALKRFQKNE